MVTLLYVLCCSNARLFGFQTRPSARCLVGGGRQHAFWQKSMKFPTACTSRRRLAGVLYCLRIRPQSLPLARRVLGETKTPPPLPKNVVCDEICEPRPGQEECSHIITASGFGESSVPQDVGGGHRCRIGPTKLSTRALGPQCVKILQKAEGISFVPRYPVLETLPWLQTTRLVRQGTPHRPPFA